MSVVSVSSASVVEATSRNDPSTLEWTISLAAGAPSPITVAYRFLSGSGFIGTQGRDAYAYFSGDSVTFRPGETSKTVTYRVEADGLEEPDESIVLEVYEARGGTLAGDAPVLRSTAWIRDDDGAGNKLALFASSPLIVEGDDGQRSAVFEISLSRPAPQAFSVSYRTVDGSARAGEDYEARSGQISFFPGQEIASVSVPILGDGKVEAAESFTLDFSPSARLAAISNGTATVLDDDAGAGLGLPSVSVEGTRSLEGTDRNDPNSLRWTITLSERPTSNVTVEYRFLSGTGETAVDAYPHFSGDSVVFRAGETSKEVTYRIDADNAPEPDETIILEVFEADGAVLAGRAPALRATSWILDDDGSANKLALFVSRPVVQERDSGTREAVFELSLSRPAPQDIVVLYQTIDGTAIAGQDYAAVSGEIAFVEGQTAAYVAVPVIGDRVSEASEVFSLGVAGPSLIAATAIGSAEIRDDDAGGSDFTSEPGADGLFDEQEIALLYEVAFGRRPDLPGLNFWIDKVYAADGLSVARIADAFYFSLPFRQAIGADPETLSNADIVEKLYANVLDRPGLASQNDPAGYAFWLGAVNDGLSRPDLVRLFAVSPENVANAAYVDDLARGEDGGWIF